MHVLDQTVHLKTDSGVYGRQLAVGILPLHWRGDRIQDIPMLDLLTFLQAIEVIESRGFPAEQAFAHHKNEVALPQNLEELVVFEYEVRLREYPGFRLKAGFVVFAVAIVLMEVIQRLILRHLVALSTKDHVAEVSAHHGFGRFGFVEVDHLGRPVELGSSAYVRSRHSSCMLSQCSTIWLPSNRKTSKATLRPERLYPLCATT